MVDDKVTRKDSTGEKKGSTKRFLIKWSLIVGAVLVLGFFVYRGLGTTHYRGTVQRVYEQQDEYRVEFVDSEGKVHVAANREIRFPYFKLDTADLHAELNRYSQTHDIVEARVWGFRFSWISMFPNVIEVAFVRSNADTERMRAENAADAVIAQLKSEGILKGGEHVRPGIVSAITEGLKKPVLVSDEDVAPKK